VAIFCFSYKYIAFFIQLEFICQTIAGRILIFPLSFLFLLGLLQFIHYKRNFIYPGSIVLSCLQANYLVHLHSQSLRSNSALPLDLFLWLCVRNPRNLTPALTISQV